MKQIPCPECGSRALRHFEDMYQVWTPVVDDDGKLGRLNPETERYAKYFECRNCGHRPSEAELLSPRPINLAEPKSNPENIIGDVRTAT